MRKVIKKISKFFTAFALVLSIISTSIITNVNAVSQAGNTVNFTWGEEIYYPKWLGNWSTKMCYIDGNLAYCLEASKDTPPANTNASYVISNNEALLKVLYYGYGGPEDVFRGDTVTSDKEKYLFTHIMASYAYSGDLFGGNTWEYLESIGVGLKARWDQIQSLPIPTNNLTFNNSNDLTVSAYFDSNEKIQRTENITLNTKADASITLPLQDNVTLHNITKGTSTTSGNATVNGGDTFYLSAPLTVTDDYSSNWLTASNLLKYAPLVIQGYANYQAEGTLSFVSDPSTLRLNVNWMDTGNLKLKKTNDIGELIDGSEFNLKHTSLDYSIDLIVKDGQITANNLPVGEYILTETVVPPGHVAINKTFNVTINSNETTEQVVVNNLRPVGNLIINKQLEQSDNINLADYDFSKVKFKITASDVINDSVTNQKLYEKGDAITTGSGKGSSSEDYVKLISGNELGNGIYTPDANGKLELTGIPMGSYNIEEIECPDGFVLDSKIKTITFTQQDYVTLTYTTSLDINNEITKTEFSKTDVGGEAIIGAFVQILDDEKNVVYEFTTSDQPIQIDGLKDGKYYFHEDLAPLGYNLANDVEFTVSNGEIQKVHLVDTITTVSKLKEDGSLLQGAELEIISTKTKNIVDKWTTGQHIFDITDEIRTELENGNTVTGTYNESENKITYKITPNSNNDDYTIMTQTDNETVYHNIDINGNETTHLIQNLISGQEYILRESKTPNGYATAPEQKFVAGTDKDVNITMTDEDTKVEISKQDITTQKELEGAHLQVKDKNGNIVDEWVSGKEPHIIKNLTVGETYTLIETIAPTNYQIAQSIQFTIEDTGDVQNVVMYDELMPVAKNVKTSDDNNMLLFGTVCLISLAGVIGIARKKKHN